MSAITPPWEAADEWGPRRWHDPILTHAIIEADKMVEMARDSGPGQPSCVMYDEDMAKVVVRANQLPAAIALDGPQIITEADAFIRQGDKGPYHWEQGPQDVTPVPRLVPALPDPPVEPSRNPEPVKPGEIPRKGQAVTTANLRLRRRAGTDHESYGVMPAGTTVLLTGGRRRVDGALWVRVKVDTSELRHTNLRGADRWLAPPKAGWVNSAFLGVPKSEYVAKDTFPAPEWEWRWYLDDAGGLDEDTVRKTLTAIAQDPRGPLRAGVNLREVLAPSEANILVRMVDDACGGAAGCYYRRMGEKARVDIGKEWFGTAWLSRVWLHEAFGHASCRSWDHYAGGPMPRDDYYGLMGNWQTSFGNHQWPDEDDIENFKVWLQGKSDLVFVRDIAPKGV